MIRIISVEMCSKDFRIFLVRVDMEEKFEIFYFLPLIFFGGGGCTVSNDIRFSFFPFDFPLFLLFILKTLLSLEDVYSDMRTYPAGLTL